MFSHSDELIRAIGPLALDIHKNRPSELAIGVPPDVDTTFFQNKNATYQLDEHSIHFTSLEARNRVVASYQFVANKEEFSPDDCRWLGVAGELWRNEIGNSDSAAGRLLGLVDSLSNIFLIATNAIETNSMRVWDILHVVESALPYLDRPSPDGIIKFVAAQHESTKNDLAGGMLYIKLEAKLAELPDTCRKIHHLLRSNASEATISLYPVSLIALAKSYPDEAFKTVLDDINLSGVILKNAALWTLGRLLVLSLVKNESKSTATTLIINNMSSSVEEIRQSAIRTAAWSAHTTNAFDDCLTKLGEAEDQYALSCIANAICTNTAEIKEKQVFGIWLKLLCKLTPANAGVLKQFDFTLSHFLTDGLQQQLVVPWLTEWISMNAEDVPRDKSISEIFNITSHELLNRPTLLSQLITDWLLADNRKLASAAAGLLSHLGVRGFRNPVFDASRLDTLEKGDMLFLARRMLGFVISEEHLLSLTISFLKTRDAQQRVFGLAYALFVNEIGKDYPSSTIEALKSAESSETENEFRNFYTKAIAEIENRISELNALPRLAELRPPPRLQREFSKARDRQMRMSMEEAQKGSIMRQICTEIPLKAGIGSFSFRDGVYGEPTYMQSISHSVSLPMREVFDSVGYDLHLFMMRIARRGEP